jgi:hypothetical protein
VWFIDRMDSPAKKWIKSAGTVTMNAYETSAESNVHPFSGSVLMKAVTAAGGTTLLYRYIGTPPLANRIGISCTFAFATASNFVNSSSALIPVTLDIDDGTTRKRVAFSYNPNTGKFYCWSFSPTTTTEIFTKALKINTWHTMKAIVDFANNKYISVLVDEIEYDASDVTITSETSASDAVCMAVMTLEGATAKQATAYFDEFKITYNEV